MEVDIPVKPIRNVKNAKGLSEARNEIPFLSPGIPPDSFTFPHLERIPLLLYRGKVTEATKSNSE